MEQARYRFQFGGDTVFILEGHLVTSYEELVQLANRDEYKDREFLEVVLIASLIGGG